MATKPTDKPILAQNDITLPVAGTDNKIALPTTLQDSGWDRGQQPAAQHFNWLFNNIYQWVDYFDQFLIDGDLEEAVEDFVGGMLTGTQSGISVTYNDGSGELEFNVNDPVITFEGASTGSATITNLSNTTFTLTSNPLANFTRNFIDGFQMKSINLSPFTEISVGAGTCSNSDNTQVINLPSGITKDIVALWTAGDAGGARPAAISLAANTWYPVFAIGDLDTGNGDVGIDNNLSATNLLATATDYDVYRRIGWVLTDASVQVVAFWQDGDDFWWAAPFQEAPWSLSTTSYTLVVGAPENTKAHLAFEMQVNAGNSVYVTVKHPDAVDTPVTTTSYTFMLRAVGSTATRSSFKVESPTNSSRQVRVRTSGTPGAAATVMTLGWTDRRGKQ